MCRYSDLFTKLDLPLWISVGIFASDSPCEQCECMHSLAELDNCLLKVVLCLQSEAKMQRYQWVGLGRGCELKKASH